MILRTITVGPLESNCYVVGCPDTHRGFVVDPGAEPERIIDEIERSGLQIEYVFNTHGHVDHIAANAAVKEATGALLVVHEADREALEKPHPFWASMVGGVEPSHPDEIMGEDDSYQVGNLTVRVYHTPGHSPGCVCLAVGDTLFTGDTLFAGSVGRTDLPGGSMETLMRSLSRLLRDFPPETKVLPGHRGPSNLGDEAAENPFLQAF